MFKGQPTDAERKAALARLKRLQELASQCDLTKPYAALTVDEAEIRREYEEIFAIQAKYEETYL